MASFRQACTCCIGTRLAIVSTLTLSRSRTPCARAVSWALNFGPCRNSCSPFWVISTSWPTLCRLAISLSKRGALPLSISTRMLVSNQTGGFVIGATSVSHGRLNGKCERPHGIGFLSHLLSASSCGFRCASGDGTVFRPPWVALEHKMRAELCLVRLVCEIFLFLFRFEEPNSVPHSGKVHPRSLALFVFNNAAGCLHKRKYVAPWNGVNSLRSVCGHSRGRFSPAIRGCRCRRRGRRIWRNADD